MKALRKGVSPVIATLLLILIAVAAAVLLYTWVGSLSANVAGSNVAGKSLTLIQATWARPATSISNHNANDFSKNQAVLILSFQPAATATQGGNAIKIDVIDVYYQGRVVCHYDRFPMTTDDKYHVGQKIGQAINGNGLRFWGYGGSTSGNWDNEDLMVPGGIIHTYSNNPNDDAAAGQTTWDSTSYINLANEVNFRDGHPFATVVAGTWEVNYVSTNYVETDFKPTKAVVKFDRFTNDYYDTDNNDSNYQNDVPNFDQVSVSQSNFAVVIWCPNVNPNVMQQVNVKITFADGSTWQAAVPLSIQ